MQFNASTVCQSHVVMAAGPWIMTGLLAAEWAMLIHYCTTMTPPYVYMQSQLVTCDVVPSHSLCEVTTSRKTTQNTMYGYCHGEVTTCVRYVMPWQQILKHSQLQVHWHMR